MIIGIVGKPNVGKTTFFKALTLMDAEAANYPFTTIDPNKGIGFVRNPCVDTFFNTQCNQDMAIVKSTQDFYQLILLMLQVLFLVQAKEEALVISF